MRQRARRIRALLGVAALAGLLVVATGAPAAAACHAFTVQVDPAEPAEGATVTVTIQRDAAVQPSSVRVRTVDETATAGSDYAGVDERVEFTDGTEQQRQIDVLDDDSAEDDETFRVELSDAEGCEVNPNFTYDSATVTIQDDDEPAQASPSPEPSPTPETAPTDTGADTEDATGGLPETGAAGLAGLGLAGVLAAAAIRRRRD